MNALTYALAPMRKAPLAPINAVVSGALSTLARAYAVSVVLIMGAALVDTMAFDATITWGNILTILSIVGSIGAMVVAMRSKLQHIDDRMKKVEFIVDRFGEALIQLARQEVRLDNFERRISNMEDED